MGNPFPGKPLIATMFNREQLYYVRTMAPAALSMNSLGTPTRLDPRAALFRSRGVELLAESDKSHMIQLCTRALRALVT